MCTKAGVDLGADSLTTLERTDLCSRVELGLCARAVLGLCARARLGLCASTLLGSGARAWLSTLEGAGSCKRVVSWSDPGKTGWLAGSC